MPTFMRSNATSRACQRRRGVGGISVSASVTSRSISCRGRVPNASAARSAVPKRFVTSGTLAPRTWRKISAGPPAAITRRWISATSSTGSTGTSISTMSRRSRRAAMKVRRSGNDMACATRLSVRRQRDTSAIIDRMPVIRIDDGGDERLADYAGVADPSILGQRGLLIAEGRFVVRRVFDAPGIRLKSMLLNDAALHALGDLVERADPDLPVYVAPADVIRAVAGFRMQRGCLAVAHRPEPIGIEALIDSSRLVLVLERVVDAD